MHGDVRCRWYIFLCLSNKRNSAVIPVLFRDHLKFALLNIIIFKAQFITLNPFFSNVCGVYFALQHMSASKVKKTNQLQAVLQIVWNIKQSEVVFNIYKILKFEGILVMYSNNSLNLDKLGHSTGRILLTYVWLAEVQHWKRKFKYHLVYGSIILVYLSIPPLQTNSKNIICMYRQFVWLVFQIQANAKKKRMYQEKCFKEKWREYF